METISKKALEVRQKVEELAAMIVEFERTEGVEVYINNNSSYNRIGEPRLIVEIRKNF